MLQYASSSTCCSVDNSLTFLLKYLYLDHAMLMGNRHLMTFDGKIYDLATKCSVLLAKDFLHNTFTIILNEEIGDSRSLYVEMNQSVINIYPRLKVGGHSQTLFLSRPDIIFHPCPSIKAPNIDQNISWT